MSVQKLQSCIDQCFSCAQVCESCHSACLEENDGDLLRCIRLDRECAEICMFTAQWLMREAEFAPVLMGVCAEVCEACEEECRKHDHMEHCRKCADACHDCAEECRRKIVN